MNGTTYAAGSLLAADFRAYLAGERELTVLFAPDAHTSLQSWSWTRNFLLLNLLKDVSSEIRVLDPADSWRSSLLDACPPLHDVNAFAVDDEDEADGGCGGRLLARGHRLHDAQHPDPRHPDPRTSRRRRDFRRIFQRNVSGRRGEQPCGSEGVAVVLQ